MTTVEPIQTDEGWLSRERSMAIVLFIITAIAIYLCYLVILPFLPALAWGMALAVMLHPLHGWIERHIKNEDIAAGLAVGIVALGIIAPVVLIGQQVVKEASSSLETVQKKFSSGEWPAAVTQNPRFAPVRAWLKDQNVDIAEQMQTTIRSISSRIPTVVTGSIWVLVQLLITLFVLFFFFRDRRKVLLEVRSLAPLSHGETSEFFKRVADTIHATIYGSLTVALVQGVLGGLMFLWLGLPVPLLWGMVMAVLATIPNLGTFVIWAPAAFYLAMSGDWMKAAILVGWGMLVIAMVDNMLYPFLVGKRMRLHTLLVFFAVLGGLYMFGAAGLILGPVILAVTDGLIDVWKRRTAAGGTVEEGVNS